MKHILSLILFLFTWFLSTSKDYAQMTSQLACRQYTTQDGLPQMQTERLWQDARGYIYIGTLSGFVRFDGKAFTPYLKGRRENIVGFCNTDDAQVWALNFRRLWKVQGKEVEQHQVDSRRQYLLNNLNAMALPNGYVLLEDDDEQNRRLCKLTEHGFDTLLTDRHLDQMTPDRKLFLDKDTTVFIPTINGVFQMSANQKKATKLSEKDDVFTLLRTHLSSQGRKEEVLLAFAADGIYTIKGKNWNKIAEASWTETSFGLTVQALNTGGIVIADEHSISLYDGKNIQQIVTGINLIRDLMVDCWGRLWAATYQGVYCFFNRSFTNYKLQDENDIVRAIATDSAGNVIMGTLDGKVLVKHPTSQPRLISDNPDDFYAPSATTVGGKVYLVGNGDVEVVEGDSLHHLGLPQDRYMFVADGGERLIVGSRQTILSYHPISAQADTLTTEILHPWCAATDANGVVWVGSSCGLFSISKHNKVTHIDYPQQLIITTMDADPRGNIFFASADSLFLIRIGAIEPLNPQIPQLSSHEVRSIHVSPQGYLAIAVLDGLFVCRVSKDCQFSDIRFFNQYNGFTILEPQMATMAEDPDGNVWLAGLEQVTSFLPAQLLAFNEEDTYVRDPVSWWQHWWVWLIFILLIALVVWAITRWYEKLRLRQRMIRLRQENLQKERRIEAIRQKAIEANTNELAQDIVKMTEKEEEERLTFRTASGVIVVNSSDIVYLKGDGNYSQLVTFYDKYTVLVGLGALAKQLNQDSFVRADRSTLVNIHYICELQPKQRRCVFRSPQGEEVETSLLAPAFKRLAQLL